mmetsp:Transcript_33391/g.73020  ORF Transcript_33391/g.73020 Transcript_33391/m.73020 type:complete len:231 (-) Transcript_33391:793-1485(-)
MKSPILHTLYVLQLSRTREEFPGVFSGECPLLRWESSEKLDHQGQMVLIPSPVLTSAGIKEEVARNQFEQHACSAPDVSSFIPVGPDDNLRRPVLPRLDIIRDFSVGTTAVAKVGELGKDLARLQGCEAFLLSHGRHRPPAGLRRGSVNGIRSVGSHKLRHSRCLLGGVKAGLCVGLRAGLQPGPLRWCCLRSLWSSLSVRLLLLGLCVLLLLLHPLLLAFGEAGKARLG